MTVERFAGGAIGEPGNRVFMLEIVSGGAAVGYVIEKFQVHALAFEAQNLLRERGLLGAGLSMEPGGVHEETPVAFRVGGLELGIADQSEVASLVVSSTDEDDDPVVYELSLGQLDAFAREALAVVASGRPACPRCGLAMDPDGHNCPRTNGDLREHRP
jgi:uncharacterized repeat protein (TIGR03847 family)